LHNIYLLDGEILLDQLYPFPSSAKKEVNKQHGKDELYKNFEPVNTGPQPQLCL